VSLAPILVTNSRLHKMCTCDSKSHGGMRPADHTMAV